MSWLKRLFDGRHRRARALEGAGRWREAAALWAEAGESASAVSALLHLAEGATSLEDRLAAWHDALRWEGDDEARAEIEGKMGLAVLEDARERGVASAEEKRRLAEAALRLERAERLVEAAEAFALLGRTDDQARCLEAAGEIEALEALLERTSKEESRESKLRRLLGDYEAALRLGARKDALAALREAAADAPDERSVGELLRRLEARLPPAHRVRLRVEGRSVGFVGRLPAVLGRADSDVVVRGTSVSRRHAEVLLGDHGVVVRDLDSRNGTLAQGLPIAGALELTGPTEIGLGDDVRVALRPHGSSSVELEVLDGLDRGERYVLGAGALRLDGLEASLSFEDGWPVLAADPGVELMLDTQKCALPVHLLLQDRLRIGARGVEVIE